MYTHFTRHKIPRIVLVNKVYIYMNLYVYIIQILFYFYADYVYLSITCNIHIYGSYL